MFFYLIIEHSVSSRNSVMDIYIYRLIQLETSRLNCRKYKMIGTQFSSVQFSSNCNHIITFAYNNQLLTKGTDFFVNSLNTFRHIRTSKKLCSHSTVSKTSLGIKKVIHSNKKIWLQSKLRINKKGAC